jgi:hypothetical protein
MAEKVLDSIKSKRMPAMVVKIDLSKAYNKTSWLYPRLMLIHVGLCLPFVNWVMSCISYVSFAILINGTATGFYKTGRGLRQGCPLSPLLFLIVAEGLCRALNETKQAGSF